eukprot:154340-Pyramimonas_sp.AAC.2
MSLEDEGLLEDLRDEKDVSKFLNFLNSDCTLQHESKKSDFKVSFSPSTHVPVCITTLYD